jgi:hypothetical protein
MSGNKSVHTDPAQCIDGKGKQCEGASPRDTSMRRGRWCAANLKTNFRGCFSQCNQSRQRVSAQASPRQVRVGLPPEGRPDVRYVLTYIEDFRYHCKSIKQSLQQCKDLPSRITCWSWVFQPDLSRKLGPCLVKESIGPCRYGTGQCSAALYCINFLF